MGGVAGGLGTSEILLLIRLFILILELPLDGKVREDSLLFLRSDWTWAPSSGTW